jgi:hypothetical protein
MLRFFSVCDGGYELETCGGASLPAEQLAGCSRELSWEDEESNTRAMGFSSDALVMRLWPPWATLYSLIRLLEARLAFVED